MFKVKEMFYSLQGEGFHTGTPAVFCRFSGCNLWNGKEKDRMSAVCKFCDTDFNGTSGEGGGVFDSPEDLASAVDAFWPSPNRGKKFVVCTGGEPLLQLTKEAVTALQGRGFFVAVETNGTLIPPPNLDWVCVSPKAGAEDVLKSGDELKVVFPQGGLDLTRLAKRRYSHRYIQPKDGDALEENTRLSVDFCLANPEWRLSLQTHKNLGIR